MHIQKKIDLIETYRNYINLSRRAGTGMELSIMPRAKITINPAQKAETEPEGDHGREKGFRR